MRDPRINPQSGDVVEVEKDQFRLVASVHAGRVAFTCRVGQQHLNSTMRESIEEWRDSVKDARIIQRG